MYLLDLQGLLCKRPRRWALALGIFACFSTALPAQLIKDGSFERMNVMPPDWSFCVGTPDVQLLDGSGTGIYGIHTPAAAGAKYLGMLATETQGEAIGQAMYLEAGTHYFGSMAAFKATAHAAWDGAGQIEIWGSSGCGTAAELLWQSGTIANPDAWTYRTIGFTPTENHTWIEVRAVLEQGSGQMSYLCIDDFQLSTTFLAVDYISFEAVPQQGAVSLNWQTAALVDRTEFAVEWSADGQSFTQVGAVAGQMGQETFAFAHSGPSEGLNYYRITGTDRAGASSHSEVRIVNAALAAGIQAFPSPASDRIHVLSDAAMQGIALLDMQGRTVYTQPLADAYATELQLPAHLPNGQYLLQAQRPGHAQFLRITILR